MVCLYLSYHMAYVLRFDTSLCCIEYKSIVRMVNMAMEKCLFVALAYIQIQICLYVCTVLPHIFFKIPL